MIIKNVFVYSGGRYDAGKIHFRNTAKEVGKLIANQDWGLVYGAGGHGLMGMVANAVLVNSGRAIGIIPRHLAEQEDVHRGLTELHLVESMHERKKKMMDLSDAFVILPGGYGTIEEAFEILTWRQLGLHNKPIVFMNIDKFWDPVRDQKQKFLEEGFITEKDFGLFKVVTQPQDILTVLREEGYQVKS